MAENKTASILIVGHPDPKLVEFGADFINSYDETEKILSKFSYAVVAVADRMDGKSCVDLLKKIRKLNPHTQLILVSQAASAPDLQALINEAGLFKSISSFEESQLQLAVREALEEFELIKQNEAFYQLRTEQNRKLQNLTQQLEERVQVRESFLIQSREKLLHTTKRLEALNRALLAIQRSSNRQSMEELINDALKSALDLSWTKILFKNQTFLEAGPQESYSQLNILSAPLFKEKELLGHIYFARKEQFPFSSDEDDFLLQVGDAVSLTIDRLMAIEKIEELKQEWDSTFDSITDPVSMVTEDFVLVRVNKAFAESSDSSVEKVVGLKCHEILFNSNTPCTGCHLGETFNLGEKTSREGKLANFTVNSQQIALEDGQKAFAVFYHDTSEQQKIQRQILESSKMAEIGTIGSSIAHEINNPLGGILAFVQIMKSEIGPEDKHREDIVEMEKAALRCKSIVENLLAFTRTSSSSDFKTTRVSDLLKVVTNIIELQTRGLGIEINIEIENMDAAIEADSNQLVQVLVNVLQNSCEALAEKLSNGQRFPAPLITIRTQSVQKPESGIRFEITDNGPGIAADQLSRVFTPFFTTKDKGKNTGLGLSVSYQIVKDHFGQMEISSVFGKSTTVIITIEQKEAQA